MVKDLISGLLLIQDNNMLITPQDKPIYIQLSDGSSVFHNDVTEIGNITATVADVVQSEDVNEFLGLIDSNADQYSVLPDVGELVEADTIYNYEGTVVLRRQTHNRIIYPPSETPALFVVYKEDGDTLDWVANEQVYAGTERVYESITYVCLQAHVTQNDWIPPNTPTLWTIKSVSGEWQAGVNYEVDDEIVYEGVNYICLQVHTSQIGWEPPNLPALWSVL